MSSRIKDDVVHDLGSSILADIDEKDVEWDSVAYVGRVLEGRAGINGYRYFAENDWEAMRSIGDRDVVIFRLLRELHTVMKDEHGASWKNCLIQISKPDYAFAIDFEYDDETRWIGGAGTYDSLTEHVMSLRPPAPE